MERRCFPRQRPSRTRCTSSSTQDPQAWMGSNPSRGPPHLFSRQRMAAKSAIGRRRRRRSRKCPHDTQLKNLEQWRTVCFVERSADGKWAAGESHWVLDHDSSHDTCATLGCPIKGCVAEVHRERLRDFRWAGSGRLQADPRACNFPNYTSFASKDVQNHCIVNDTFRISLESGLRVLQFHLLE